MWHPKFLADPPVVKLGADMQKDGLARVAFAFSAKLVDVAALGQCMTMLQIKCHDDRGGPHAVLGFVEAGQEVQLGIELFDANEIPAVQFGVDRLLIVHHFDDRRQFREFLSG